VSKRWIQCPGGAAKISEFILDQSVYLFSILHTLFGFFSAFNPDMVTGVRAYIKVLCPVKYYMAGVQTFLCLTDYTKFGKH